MKRPVIIDTDPGVDDALALLMAFAYDEFDIKAITVVAGNQTLDKTLSNALKLADIGSGAFGLEIPVAKGASAPLFRELVTAGYVHGESGLADLVLPESKRKIYEKSACDTIYEKAAEAGGKLLIIALGPLTNIAMALLKYPDIKPKIDEIILMGGSCGLGNTTPCGEFNIFADPEAAKIVFESGLKVTMAGLDVTHRALLFDDEIEEIVSHDSKVRNVLDRLLNHILSFCKTDIGRHKGAVMHDPFAMAFAIDPSVMISKPYRVDVETKGQLTYGKTVVDIYGVTGKPPNAEVGVEIDRDRFVGLYKRLMAKYHV